MRGDILIIREEHRRAARRIAGWILHELSKTREGFVITVAGESGAGKSETAAALGEILNTDGYPAMIIQQDDFFVYPPKTNAAMRVKSGGAVGPQEVRLDLLNEIVRNIRRGVNQLTKPLVIFAEDRIVEETLDISPFRVFIIEGTYTTLLDDVDCRIFIDRNMEDTREDRMKRNRENQDAFLEKILRAEHGIISAHKTHANIIVTRDFNVVKQKVSDEK